MTDIGNEIRTFLQTKSAITDVCETRMRADALAENETLPAVVYSVVSTTPVEHLTASAGVAMTRIQIDCYAATRLAANSLAEVIRTAAFQGAGGSVLTTSWVYQVSCEGALRHGIDWPTEGSSLARYIATSDYVITHAHTVPS